MPSDDERIAQGDRAIRWLEQHWKHPRTCPICQSAKWGVNSTVHWDEYTGGEAVFSENVQSFPVFTVMCNVCGYTFAMNALVSGVVAKPAPRTSE